MYSGKWVRIGLSIALVLAYSMPGMASDESDFRAAGIKHVLPLSIDGMHAEDFYNCAHGIEGVDGGARGAPYCPNMAELSHTGINYVDTQSLPTFNVRRVEGEGIVEPDSRQDA